MITEQPSNEYDAKHASKYFSILLRRAAVSAGNMILGFLNLITAIPCEKAGPSVDSSAVVTAGPPKSSAPKSESVEYYVQTVTGDTHSSNKIIIQTPKSMPPCSKSIAPMEFDPGECAKIREKIMEGTLDLRTISLAQWMHVSFLSLFNQQETHIQQTVLFQGSVYSLHACVNGVVPPEAVARLKEKQ